MVTGHVRFMQQTDQRRVRIIYEKNRWSEVWNHNPRIATPKEQGDFQEYRPRNGGLRPYCTAKSQEKWTWTDYTPHIGELYFSQGEKDFGTQFSPDIIVEPSLKPGASPNKDWGWERWQDLVHLLIKAGRKPVQIGRQGTKTLNGCRLIQTDSFRMAAVVLSRAKAAVLPEGGLHHAAAALGTPAVVIFGGFISPRQTGYAVQKNFFTGGAPCGNRLACPHCKYAMEQIKPEMVFEAACGL